MNEQILSLTSTSAVSTQLSNVKTRKPLSSSIIQQKPRANRIKLQPFANNLQTVVNANFLAFSFIIFFFSLGAKLKKP